MEEDNDEHEELKALIVGITHNLDTHNWYLCLGASNHIISNARVIQIL